MRNPIKAAGGYDDIEPNPAGSVVDERLRPALAEREQLRDDAEVLLGNVDRDTFDRLVQAPVDRSRHDLRLAHRQLEALAAHLLDEHRQLELSSPLHLPRVRAGSRQDAERDVAYELGREPALDEARRSACPLAARRAARC